MSEIENHEKTLKKAKAPWGMRSLFILLFVLIGAAFGGMLGYFQPNRGAIETKLEAPRVADLNNYFSLFSTYRLVNDDGKMSDEAVAGAVYQEFLKQLTSTDLLKQYLREHDFVNQLAQVTGNSVEQEIQQFITLFKVDSNQQVTTIRLENMTDNVAMSESIIDGFLSFINGQTKEILYADLIGKWKNLFLQVKNAADNNLGDVWKGKLQMMMSVQPLDDELRSYRIVAAPTLAQATMPNIVIFGGIGAGLGLLLGFLLSIIFVRRWD